MKKKSTKPKNFNIIPPDLSAKEKALELARKDIITFGQMKYRGHIDGKKDY